MTTAKAKSATGPQFTKSVTATVKESTLEAINAAAEVVGAPKNASVSIGNAPYLPTPSPGGEVNDTYPWQVTFTWSESAS